MNHWLILVVVVLTSVLWKDLETLILMCRAEGWVSQNNFRIIKFLPLSTWSEGKLIFTGRIFGRARGKQFNRSVQNIYEKVYKKNLSSLPKTQLLGNSWKTWFDFWNFLEILGKTLTVWSKNLTFKIFWHFKVTWFFKIWKLSKKTPIHWKTDKKTSQMKNWWKSLKN